MITPKYVHPAALFAPVVSQEFVHIVSFLLLVYFYVAVVYRGNYFAVPVYDTVLGPASTCSVV